MFVQGSGDALRLHPLHHITNYTIPNVYPPSAPVLGPQGSLLTCLSNPVWWNDDELAYVGPEGVHIVQVSNGQQMLYSDDYPLLPGQLRFSFKQSCLPCVVHIEAATKCSYTWKACKSCKSHLKAKAVCGCVSLIVRSADQ